MNFKNCTVTLWIATFLVVLTPKSTQAFSIVPANPEDIQFYRKESGYQVKNLEGKTLLSTKLWWDSNTWNDEIGGVTEIQRGGTGEFKRMLSFWSFFSSDRWDFKSAQNDLEGSFKILTYQACGVNDGCGGASTDLDPVNPFFRGVGSLFHLEYHPEGNDPRPGEGKLHWIQLVQTNYKAGYPHGLPYVEIDNGGNKQDPYYDTGSRFADENFFIDKSYSPYGEKQHYFNAQLYGSSVFSMLK